MLKLWRRIPIVVLLAAGLCLGCEELEGLFAAEPSPSPSSMPGQQLPIEAIARIGDLTFELEVARTPQQQQMGLMFRDPLPDNRGMLFPYDPPQTVAFWMYNVPTTLDMIFILDDEVVYIANDVPGCPTLPCPSYGPGSTQLVEAVLELRGGRAGEIGLQIGDPITIEDL